MHNKPEIDTIKLTQICKKIKSCYWGRWGELPFEKQFHWASRLALFGDVAAKKAVQDLRTQFMEHEPGIKTLLAKQPSPEKVNYFSLRKQYFSRFPWLYGAEAAAFRIMHANVQFNVDERAAYIEALGGEQVIKQRAGDLLADEPAMQSLSSYAINWLYLLDRFLLPTDDPALLATVEKLASSHTPQNNPVLSVYLVTHAIIGDSVFYSQPVPPDNKPTYHKLLGVCEAMVSDDQITLDAKLEFLVACNLVEYSSPLQAGIISQAIQLFDDNLGYLVDPNKPDKNDLAGAEHRNVLFLLAVQSLDNSLA